jgi:O-succinylbenzoic acid--CoA ligase
LLSLPINFIAGANVLIRSLVSETQPVIMNTRMPFTTDGFSRAASMLSAARRYTSLVPTQLKRLLDASEVDDFLLRQLQRFDAILVGGQGVDRSLLSRANDKNIKVVVSYGMTETCGGCVYDGIPLPGVEVRIGADSQVELSGPTLAEGVATAGWYRTNDIGELIDGKLVIHGRANRVLNSGGLKVSLEKIEELVRDIGGVAEAAAIALPDAEWGERAAVVYIGSPEVADYIASEALAELGRAAKPVRVIRVSAIPKLVSGKTDYLALAKHFE